MTIADANDKIAEKVISGYKTVENTVISRYKAIENAVTGNYKKVEDKFVDKFLRKNGETVEDAKARIEQEQAGRKENKPSTTRPA